MSDVKQDAPADLSSLRTQLIRECEKMAEHLLTTGQRIPPRVFKLLQEAVPAPSADGSVAPARPDMQKLAMVHDQLVQLIAPALPQTLMLMKRKESGQLSILESVPFLRRMALVTVLCLVAFIGLSLSEMIDGGYKTIFNSNHFPLLVTELFFMSAAGLGASFAALFEASSYIAKRNFDPGYEATYWIRFILGVIAGFILVTLVPFESEMARNTGYAQPTLAMLGGFSASVVYRILDRMVKAVESLVRGSTEDMLASQERLVKARAAEDQLHQRTKVAGALLQFQKQLSTGAEPEQMQRQLDQLLGDLGLETGGSDPKAEAPSAEAGKKAA